MNSGTLAAADISLALVPDQYVVIERKSDETSYSNYQAVQARGR